MMKFKRFIGEYLGGLAVLVGIVLGAWISLSLLAWGSDKIAWIAKELLTVWWLLIGVILVVTFFTKSARAIVAAIIGIAVLIVVALFGEIVFTWGAWLFGLALTPIGLALIALGLLAYDLRDRFLGALPAQQGEPHGSESATP